MTINLLVSVSLFALVTSRPILSSDVDHSDFAPASSTFQTGVQAAFRIHPCKDDLTSDAARFHFQTAKEQIEDHSELAKGSVAAITSFQIPSEEQPLFEALLHQTSDGQDKFDANNEHEPTSSEPVADDQQEVPSPKHESPSAPLVVLAFSCVAAFLALACTALTLYIIKSLRSQMLVSKTAWELLPRFWRCPRSQENTSAPVKEHLSCRGSLLLQTERLLDVEEESAQRHGSRPGNRPLYFDAVSDMESEWDDMDEKYHDALDMTPLPPIHDLPLEDNVSRPSHFDDPPLPSMGSNPPDQTTADRSTPSLIRELCSAPVSRPAWSVRATDSPALGLSSRQGGVDATPQPLIHPRRRAYRSPVPEFDIALAMQLRPGLGIGADSAWMARFLMAIFGWFAVALTGNAR
ncbi:hypothetical protein EV363DRAFT_1451445 [Boletus edulis]|nr:hypothetical protein EV363DRAFT_1451445 [Boletus edulis]